MHPTIPYVYDFNNSAYGAVQNALLLPPTKSNDKPNLENEMEFAELVFDGLGYG